MACGALTVRHLNGCQVPPVRSPLQSSCSRFTDCVALSQWRSFSPRKHNSSNNEGGKLILRQPASPRPKKHRQRHARGGPLADPWRANTQTGKTVNFLPLGSKTRCPRNDRQKLTGTASFSRWRHSVLFLWLVFLVFCFPHLTVSKATLFLVDPHL